MDSSFPLVVFAQGELNGLLTANLFGAVWRMYVFPSFRDC